MFTNLSFESGKLIYYVVLTNEGKGYSFKAMIIEFSVQII